MGANNSILALLKVSEAIATNGIATTNEYLLENSITASVDISDKLDWQYFVEYDDNELFGQMPKPTNISRDIKTKFILDPKGIDDRKLKNVAKTQITEYIFSIQKDEKFHEWMESLGTHIGKSEIDKVLKTPITPIYLVNSINTAIEMYLTPDAICTYSGCIDTYSNIGTRSIIIKNSNYPVGLNDYANKSIQHAYVASIAGVIISILKQNASTEYIVYEIYKNTNSVRKIDFMILFFIATFFIIILILGGYNIFTVIINEAHHQSQHHPI